jgi:hypothetical protein
MATDIAATAYRPEVITAFGRKGAGPIPFSGMSVGESIIAVINVVTRASAASSFESTCTHAGQIQQSSASDLSGQEFFFIVDHLR